jgi:hypothetical protein
MFGHSGWAVVKIKDMSWWFYTWAYIHLIVRGQKVKRIRGIRTSKNKGLKKHCWWKNQWPQFFIFFLDST